ncbi:MAG: zinc-dependent metalloprotease [Nocardioidaceae bacterium]
MGTNPGDNRPDEPDDDQPDDDIERHDSGGSEPGTNPFAGTPLEQMFGAFGGQGMPDLAGLMSQVQQMFKPHEGSVNWELATQIARQTVAQHPDPTPSTTDREAVSDAVRLAEHWLDSVTELAAGTVGALAWSRAEWIEATMPVWQRVVEPVAAHVVSAMGEALPEEAKSMAGPLMGLLGQAGGAMFGQQVGQAIGELATEVVATTDVGLPLAPRGTAALLPANVRAFGEGLDLSEADVMLYLALRECAHQRLFAHVPWLPSHLLGAVEDYGRGTTIDVSRIESALSGIDPTNPEAIQEAMSGGLFEPQNTPTQQAALVRLETMLALVEGWVDEVVTQAVSERMPSAPALREAVRRRRASGGPAEQTFASLVGLELRPRRLRDAATLWGALRDAHGPNARDAVWEHPDLMPTSADLDDPLGFAAGDRPTQTSDEDFDAALADLLDSDAEDRGAPGPDAETDAGPDAKPDAKPDAEMERPGDLGHPGAEPAPGDSGERGEDDDRGDPDDPRPDADR